MKLYHLITGLLRVNTFLLQTEEGNLVVIDPGENYKKIKEAEQNLGMKIKAVLLTHAHFDHAGCAKKLQDDGALIYVSELDAPKLKNEYNLGSHFGRKFEYLTADFTFDGGQTIDVLGIKFKVLSTPGHTDGSVCFMLDNMLFTGDTLFYGSVGRTDMLGGDRQALNNSIKMLFSLDGDYSVYPGHGDFTTLEHERKYNILAEYD